jgi:hypothetical protein
MKKRSPTCIVEVDWPKGWSTVPTCQRGGFSPTRRWLHPKVPLRTGRFETVNQAVKDPGATLLSWGFGPFSALVRKSDQYRVCRTRLCCTLRFSQPLSALFLSWPSRPCFMPVALLGFWTLQSFPLLKIESPSGFPSRLDVTTCSTPQPKSQRLFQHRPSIQVPTAGAGATGVEQAARLHGFNPFSSPFIRCPVLPVQRSRCSPGFGPLQGVLPLRLRRRFRVFFLLRTREEPFRRKFLPCTIEFQRTKRLACLASEAADLLGVFALIGFPGA